MEKSLASQLKCAALRASWCLLAAVFFAIPMRSQDVQVSCTQNPTCTLTPAGGLPWSSTAGANGITFIFRPLAPHVSIYIFVHNLNPSSAHGLTLAVWQTPFSQAKAPSLSLNQSNWIQDAISQNTNTPVSSCVVVDSNHDSSPPPASGTQTGLGACFVNTMFAAQVAINIQATTQAGVPDNFELAIIQEPAIPGTNGPGSSSSIINVQNGQCAVDALTCPFQPVWVGGTSNGDTTGVVSGLQVDEAGDIYLANTNQVSLAPAILGQSIALKPQGAIAGEPLLVAQVENCPTTVSIALAAASTVQIAAPTAAKKIHVCSLMLTAGVAVNVSINEGTGATCATANTLLNGAGGMSLSVGIPFVWNSSGTIFNTNVTGDGLCLTSGATGNANGTASIGIW